MDKHDNSLLVQYGIKAETKVLFHFDGHRYERLADAVNYARLQQAQPPEGGDSITPGHEN